MFALASTIDCTPAPFGVIFIPVMCFSNSSFVCGLRANPKFTLSNDTMLFMFLKETAAFSVSSIALLSASTGTFILEVSAAIQVFCNT